MSVHVRGQGLSGPASCMPMLNECCWLGPSRRYKALKASGRTSFQLHRKHLFVADACCLQSDVVLRNDFSGKHRHHVLVHVNACCAAKPVQNTTHGGCLHESPLQPLSIWQPEPKLQHTCKVKSQGRRWRDVRCKAAQPSFAWQCCKPCRQLGHQLAVAKLSAPNHLDQRQAPLTQWQLLQRPVHAAACH